LPEAILQAVAARLEDQHLNVREAAAQALCGQLVLPEAILQTVIARLKNHGLDFRRTAVKVRAAVRVLNGQSVLPEAILQALVARLKGQDWEIRKAAARVLNRQSVLPETILQAVVAQLEDQDRRVRQAAARVLGGQSVLPEAILQAVELLLVSKRAVDSVEYVLRRHKKVYSVLPSIGRESVESLYETWLRRSFKEHLSLYFEDNCSYIEMPEGFREISFINHIQQDQFRSAVQEAQANFRLQYFSS
jgi:hypothetical protein